MAAFSGSPTTGLRPGTRGGGFGGGAGGGIGGVSGDLDVSLAQIARPPHRSEAELLSLASRVTERDRLKKELVRAQKQAHGLEKTVLGQRRELEAAGDMVRALQRERVLLTNQLGLLEQRLAEGSAIGRATSARMQRLMAQVQAQQLQIEAQQQELERLAPPPPVAAAAAAATTARPKSGRRLRGGGGGGVGVGVGEEDTAATLRELLSNAD